MVLTPEVRKKVVAAANGNCTHNITAVFKKELCSHYLDLKQRNERKVVF